MPPAGLDNAVPANCFTHINNKRSFIQMSDEKNHVLLMFPNNSVSVMVGQTVISELANLGYFIPDGVHEQAASTYLDELKLASAGLDVTVEKVTTFEAIEKFQYVVFPSLDIHPRKTRLEYSVMCRNLFKYVVLN